MYNAVIVSKLTYGLETLQLVDGLFNRLNAFHIRAIRRILNIPPTFINRDMTNNYVLQQADRELNKDNAGPKRKVKLISDIIKHRQASLLGHVIRSEERDPMEMVSFGNEELTPLEDIQRRVGRLEKNGFMRLWPEHGRRLESRRIDSTNSTKPRQCSGIS